MKPQNISSHECSRIRLRRRFRRIGCIRRAYEIYTPPKNHDDSLFTKNVAALESFLARFAVKYNWKDGCMAIGLTFLFSIRETHPILVTSPVLWASSYRHELFRSLPWFFQVISMKKQIRNDMNTTKISNFFISL